MDFIYKVQWQNIIYIIFNIKINQKRNRKEIKRHQLWELDLMGLLYRNSKI